MKALKLPEEKINFKITLLLILVAYIASIMFRMIWINDHSAVASFHWNNQLMINTNDGYWFAEGARDLLAGGHEPNDLSPVDNPVSILTAFLAKILPISFETLILYMPAFLGSLIVVPLVLAGRAIGQTGLGFIAALVGSIAHSYYNRTMAGYYDTDMLNIVFPTFELYALIFALTHQRNRFLIPISISIALYQWWYPQAYTLDTALLVAVFVYGVIFDRKNLYIYKIALFILIGILALPVFVKIALAVALYALFHYQDTRVRPFFWGVFAGVALLYFATGGIDPIWAQLKAYVIKDTTSQGAGLHFYNVVQTVREASQIPFSVFAERISGNPVVFIVAFIGYVLALIAYRPLLITLPLTGLGFVAMFGGLRFTVYAVPTLALGLGYLVMLIATRVPARPLQYALATMMTIGAIYPNYVHIKEYQVPTVFTTQEVQTLVDFGKKAKREDYVVSWWDYGYPIRYYSDTKTWVDGGKHNGDVNFPAAFALTHNSPTAVANMLRLFTEYTEKSFHEANKTQPTDMEYMMTKEGKNDPEAFLTSLENPDYHLPAKTRDVYLMLPFRMMEIVPTVRLFANLDLATGEPISRSFFYFSQGANDTGAMLDLGNGVVLDKKGNEMVIGGQKIPLKSFVITNYDENKKLSIQNQVINPNGDLTLIYMKSYGAFVVADQEMMDSTFVQMFVFENYDPALFEPVSLTPMIKIYKLKK